MSENKKTKMYDSHMHYMVKIPVRESVQSYEKIFEEENLVGANILALPEDVGYLDPQQNLKALYLKHVLYPRVRAFAGVEFDKSIPYENKSEDFLRQIKEYWNAGYDGIKVYAGKPYMRRSFGIPLCDECYDAFYAYAEENRIPIIMHLADPCEFWDIEKIPKDCLENGWFCDDTYPPFEAFYEETFAILDKFPRLRLTLAHWGFFSDSIERAERFMAYPNTLIDTTPGSEQFANMHAYGIQEWIAFIEKYSDRILFGTDDDNIPLPLGELSRWRRRTLRRNTLQRNFFETDGEYNYCGRFDYKGILLDPKHRSRIYFENPLREYPEVRPIDYTYCYDRIAHYRKTAENGSIDEYNLECMEEDFKNTVQN